MQDSSDHHTPICFTPEQQSHRHPKTQSPAALGLLPGAPVLMQVFLGLTRLSNAVVRVFFYEKFR